MRPTIVLFGDSITEESFGDGGWGAALAHHFSRTADVVLRGYSGYNTRWARMVLDRVLDGLAPPLAVTVFFGANDASLPDRSSRHQNVPLAEYQDNLRSICASLKERWPKTVVILITPPPIDEDGRLRYVLLHLKDLTLRFPFAYDSCGLPERTNEYAGTYAKACVAVAGESNIPVIDLWSKMQLYPDWEKSFLRDGLHFTARGNKILFDEVVETLRKQGLSLETLPFHLPLFRDIDPSDPLKTFRELGTC